MDVFVREAGGARVGRWVEVWWDICIRCGGHI